MQSLKYSDYGVTSTQHCGWPQRKISTAECTGIQNPTGRVCGIGQLKHTRVRLSMSECTNADHVQVQQYSGSCSMEQRQHCSRQLGGTRHSSTGCVRSQQYSSSDACGAPQQCSEEQLDSCGVQWLLKSGSNRTSHGPQHGRTNEATTAAADEAGCCECDLGDELTFATAGDMGCLQHGTAHKSMSAAVCSQQGCVGGAHWLQNDDRTGREDAEERPADCAAALSAQHCCRCGRNDRLLTAWAGSVAQSGTAGMVRSGLSGSFCVQVEHSHCGGGRQHKSPKMPGALGLAAQSTSTLLPAGGAFRTQSAATFSLQAVQWAESAQSRQRLGQKSGLCAHTRGRMGERSYFTGEAVIESEANTRPVCVSDG